MVNPAVVVAVVVDPGMSGKCIELKCLSHVWGFYIFVIFGYS